MISRGSVSAGSWPRRTVFPFKSQRKPNIHTCPLTPCTVLLQVNSNAASGMQFCLPKFLFPTYLPCDQPHPCPKVAQGAQTPLHCSNPSLLLFGMELTEPDTRCWGAAAMWECISQSLWSSSGLSCEQKAQSGGFPCACCKLSHILICKCKLNTNQVGAIGIWIKKCLISELFRASWRWVQPEAGESTLLESGERRGRRAVPHLPGASYPPASCYVWVQDFGTVLPQYALKNAVFWVIKWKKKMHYA